MLLTKKLLSFCGLLAVPALLMTSGCHSSGRDVPAQPSAATLAAGKAASIQQVQSNPNLSPEQKATIISQIQGQGTPGGPPPR